ncbi:MAG: glycerol-3-phosphate acyltransferase [Acidimicrobiia bacterium]
MTGALAFVLGYVMGGTPTADWIAQRRGIDLRAQGSGNPGANNALRVGGKWLAATILTVEIVKGIVCVGTGAFVGGEAGMALAGMGAALGNVLNPYRSLRGGQGLGISAGVLIAALPLAAGTGIVVIAIVARIVRWTAPATLAALVAIVATARWSPVNPWWGIESREWATLLTIGLAATLAPKQLRRLTRSGRPSRPQPA